MPDADSHASGVTVHASQAGDTATVTVADLLALTRIADRVRVVDDPHDLH